MTQSDLSGIAVTASQKMPEIILTYATQFLDDLPVAFYACDREGYIIFCNQAAVKLWGTEPRIGQDRWTGAWKMFHPNGQPMPPDEYPVVRAYKTGTALKNEEIIIQRQDGSYRILLSNPTPVFDHAGVFTGITNTFLDITEQRSSEEKQAVHNAIVESSDDAIISKTLEGIIISWNKGAERIFGYTADEIIGKHISQLIPEERLHEEDLIISKVSNNEKIDHFETIRVNKSGNKIPISLTVSPVRNGKGQIIGASKIARDISRQRLAEEHTSRYTQNLETLNTIGNTIAEDLDIQSILQKVTDATTKLTGAGFGAFFHNVVNKNGEAYMLYTLSGAPKEAFEKFGMPRNTAVFHPTFTGQGVVRVDDITKDPRYGKNPPHYGKPKGHLPVVSYLAVPVTSKSGEVIGGLFFGHPEPGKFTAEHEQLVSAISAQAAIALDNAKLYEEIKILNAKKDEFIGLASHELKTPVTSISGYLQIIEQNFTGDARSKAFISKARTQVNKLTSLISDLLDVSKIQTSKLPFSFASFDLSVLLKEVTEVMQQTNPSHNILLNDNESLIIEADHQRIEQVLINLISNAVKYSPRADRIIINSSATHDKVKVSIQDFGIGIDTDQQDRIFSRFYRVENLAPHMSGLGIGLYICREIITRHRGTLNVKSIPGEGSTFYFEIPTSQTTK